MADRVPSAKALRGIRLRALAYIHAARQLRVAAHRCGGFPRYDRSADAREAVDEYRRAFEAWHAPRARLESFHRESGGFSPRGWPEDVLATLRKITSMLKWDLNFIFAEPDEMPGLEEEIKSLPAAEERSEEAALTPSASAAFEKVPSVRELERRCLGGVHDDMETTARALEQLGYFGRWEIRTDARGRRSLWVVWRNKPEGLGRRTRKRKGPRS
jgi:hypothetical protein